MSISIVMKKGGRTKHIGTDRYYFYSLCGVWFSEVNTDPPLGIKPCKSCLHIAVGRIDKLMKCVNKFELFDPEGKIQ